MKCQCLQCEKKKSDSIQYERVAFWDILQLKQT